MSTEYPQMLYPGGKPNPDDYLIAEDADAERVAASSGYVRVDAPAESAPRAKPARKTKPEA